MQYCVWNSLGFLLRSSSKRYARRTMGPNERFTFSDNRRRSIEGRGESFNSRSTTTADSYGVVTDGLNRVSLHSSSANRLPTVSNSRPSASNSTSVHGSPPPSVESMIHLNHIRTTLPMDRTNYGSLRHRSSARTTPTSDMARAEYRLSHPVELTLEQRHSRNFESKNNNWGSKTKVNGALDRFLERFMTLIDIQRVLNLIFRLNLRYIEAVTLWFAYEVFIRIFRYARVHTHLHTYLSVIVWHWIF